MSRARWHRLDVHGPARIAQFLFPFYALIPSGVLGLSVLTRVWVPMDDEHTMFFVMGAAGGVGAGMDLREVQPTTPEWFGRFRLPQTAANDYQIDRQEQRSLQSYTGLSSVHLEDLAITESMGSLLDRSDRGSPQGVRRASGTGSQSEGHRVVWRHAWQWHQ